MIDIWLLVVTIVCFIIMMVTNIYLLVIYLHPDDKGFTNNFLQKLMILLGSAVLWCFVLLLPLDVANTRGQGAGFNIALTWEILFWIYLAFLIFILPMITFYYETDEQSSCIVRFFKSFAYTILILVIVITLTLIAWGLAKTSETKRYFFI